MRKTGSRAPNFTQFRKSELGSRDSVNRTDKACLSASADSIDLLEEYEQSSRVEFTPVVLNTPSKKPQTLFSPRKRKLQKAASFLWPDHIDQAGTVAGAAITAVGAKGLKTLKVLNWWLVSNPDFNQIQFEIRTKAAATAKRWCETLSVLGHPYDVILDTKEFKYQMYRPTCVEQNQNLLSFWYLTKPSHSPPELE